MYIAMNRFKVVKDSAVDFEQVWLGRDSQLGEMPGFVEFHLLRGPEHEDHILYASHTIWASKADFEAWTRSEQFRKAHGRVPTTKPLYLGHPQFEGFETIQTLGGAGADAAA
ncbi:MAG: antibiotic biosynthesis monooxygenase [Methylobacterium sp.]|jgi:heme-degrading monooxygenase HmoA|uniref:antibiotic biosynthesis monooxygenase family protein n=1 Tax=unclassified Methylobacterium TaxID=2615210 RepID=UPI0006F747B4|nr:MULTISPECIES: antibiotic biosynthesis monooxygenase [unclassified Methylobacterium]KQP10683.1 antibiotic biosynthesis monooxygenase [Methylobacterium sp. Leaf99]MDO9426358.1 antibiotic biosynthesis monooxygenase [Methylobacterium sp.]TXM77793.1 antibiotic biosynthesis monooxygenase [Methylobacterium sp. WL69]